MANFKELYRSAFENLGRPLISKDAIPARWILKAESDLGVNVPKALCDYYLVAGRESQFNRFQNRLLRPDEWFVDKGRLVFFEENQVVVVWGISATPRQTEDPPVEQGVNGETIEWYPEHENSSVF